LKIQPVLLIQACSQ